MLIRRNLSTCSRFPRQAQRLVLRSTTVAHSVSPLSVSVRQVRQRPTNCRFNSSSSKPAVDNDSNSNTNRKYKLNRYLGMAALASISASIYFYLLAKGDKDLEPEKKQLILSPAEATAKLRENQLTTLLKNKSNNGLVWRYDTNQVASNDPIEDAKSEMIFKSKDGDKLFFAVFDGHGGWNCSRYLSSHLIAFVKKHLDQAYQSVAGQDQKNDDSRQQLVTNTIQNAFLSLDYEIVFRAIARLLDALKDDKTPATVEESVVTALAGSCAIMAYIDAAKKDLYVASTGDSRAIIGIKDPVTGDWKALPLSEDQTGRNENEVKRLQTEHPDEGNIISHGRVFGGLEPTRAFGDARYKWDKITHDRIHEKLFDEKRNIPGGERNKTPPYVTARPEVVYHKIDKNDKFLVLATDGLWDKLSNDEVAKLVGGFLDGRPVEQKIQSNEQENVSKPKKFAYVDENASTHLIRNALGGAAQELLCSLLSLPSPMARRFRDDITVTVVFFSDSEPS